MIKQLARLNEMNSAEYVRQLEAINRVARRGGLTEYTTYSRMWEYPWLWGFLEPLSGRRLKVLDVGSEKSPFPWFLATQGFQVSLSDVQYEYWKVWQTASRALNAHVGKRLCDACDLDLATGSVDIYLSVSVIEHIADKRQALAEAARVIKPGGLLAMTFDICEPTMGMTFPDWNGRALSMQEFDALFQDSTWFEAGAPDLAWTVEDIPSFLAWNRTTAPHHNYIAGAAVVQRNAREWHESAALTWARRVRAVANPPVRRFFSMLAAEHPEIARRLPTRFIARRAWSFFKSA